MKVAVSLVLALALVSTAAPPISAAPAHQVMQGTEIHLTLLTPISSSHSREGDPFVAVLSQPVAFDSRIVLPAGTRVNGIIGTIQKPKRFSVFRGQAYMNLMFKTIEIDSRLIPVRMSILAIGEPRIDSYSKPRHDMKIVEGEVIEAKHDYKGDVKDMAIGGAGGSLIGIVFSNVTRGLGVGLGAGAVYVVARKGREINLPANTGILARMDSTITVPIISAGNIMPYSPSSR
ncbi:MAG TPA: hypothetical protein VEI54_10390 [Candidatus Limnocylindrales bacterium]|nr:hypothetical protein [Candidatus Limnocylindrales bacterium]